MKTKNKTELYSGKAFVSFLSDPTNGAKTHRIFTDKKLGYVCVNRDTQKIISHHTNLRKCEQQAKLALINELTESVGAELIGKNVVFKKPRFYGDDKKLRALYARIPTWCSGTITEVGLNASGWPSRRRFNRTIIIKMEDKNFNDVYSKISKDTSSLDSSSFISNPNGSFLSYTGDVYVGGTELASKLSKLTKKKETYENSAKKVESDILKVLNSTEEL